ncbi:3-phosphoshikimate 1-carboxyvinyltransferase [Psychroflexus sp. ALD_RP9]|nr:3-phosphoshikimate 1-carboxyvinyltransferase [Psychroflexus sp. ALD_RP9]QSS98354.1 3-phosphoshikimate 1-carboxyvinyltransferase [Psychroflexus sp. ALD_RP9]
MNFLEKSTTLKFPINIQISGSKSESNRALILDYVLGGINIHNLSDSDDTKHLINALKQLDSESKTIKIDVGHAGTTMRFLTALCATMHQQEFVISGSKRMHQRPIKPLVDALKNLGADISYLDHEGYPPLKIRGKNLTKNKLSIQANISSQYISALMLIAPKFPQGLSIKLKGNITSRPYLEMTKALLEQQKIRVDFNQSEICVHSSHLNATTSIEIESDWSSASYHYALVALSVEGFSVKLTNFKLNSVQGDAALRSIYKKFGVKTEQVDPKTIKLTKFSKLYSDINIDLIKTPDLAQTIAVTCLGLGIKCELRGLHTLKIKETDRLKALKTELQKLGALVEISDSTLKLQPNKKLISHQIIETYNDHRMALAFAPLALKTILKIENPDVVSKSYPHFWEDLNNYGITSHFAK